MASLNAQRTNRLDRLGLIAGPVVVLILLVWFAGWTGPERPHAGLPALYVLLRATPWAIGWLAAAYGFGWPLRRWLDPQNEEPFVVQLGLGIAAMLIIDATLGAIGALQWGGSVGAWTVLLIGIALAFTCLRLGPSDSDRSAPTVPWLFWMAAPAIAVLLLAACSAPGWLWASEFGGYDAMSYHLQLPKEWVAIGRIEPLSHNVYSYLPGYVEAAYYHLAILVGDPINAVYSCQLLHAAMALLTAVVVARLVGRLVGPPLAGPIGSAAAVILIGTPWVVVVGSLGYNEMAVTLFLAVALYILIARSPTTWKYGGILGLLAAAACGAKLTAAGFVVLPLVIVALFAIPRRCWLGVALAGAVAGLIGLLPYLLRNFVYSGNPVFPFATGFFGLAHWSQNQVGNWMAGHVSDAPIGSRFVELWNQLWRYGLGANPNPAEPFKPQWSILPWLALASLLVCLTRVKLRRVSLQLTLILGFQILFWLAMTHLKSRFLVIGVVGAAISTAMAIGILLLPIQSRIGTKPANALLAVLLLVWSSLPVLIFAGDPLPPGAPREKAAGPAAMIAWAHMFTGDGLLEEQRIELAQAGFPAIYLNHLLPDDARILLLGDAKPLYYRADIAYQTTWDRGVLSQLMQDYPMTPGQWAAELRIDGFTHILVSDEMLLRWTANGWSDPMLTLQNVRAFAARFGVVEHDWPNLRITLYRLR